MRAAADGKAEIEPSLCYGCGLCAGVCPFGAIVDEAHGKAAVSYTHLDVYKRQPSYTDIIGSVNLFDEYWCVKPACQFW